MPLVSLAVIRMLGVAVNSEPTGAVGTVGAFEVTGSTDAVFPAAAFRPFRSRLFVFDSKKKPTVGGEIEPAAGLGAGALGQAELATE